MSKEEIEDNERAAARRVRENERDLENMKAAIGIMGRAMAPVIMQTFESAETVTGINRHMLYLVLRHKPGGDLKNINDVTIELRSMFDHQKIELREKEGKNSISDDAKEVFPILTEMIQAYAEAWSVTPYDLFITIRLAEGKQQGRANSMGLEILTKKGIVPAMRDTLM